MSKPVIHITIADDFEVYRESLKKCFSADEKLVVISEANNGVELLDGLPRKLATMDACRLEIGRKAAEIIAGKATPGEKVELFPTLQPGDTIRR